MKQSVLHLQYIISVLALLMGMTYPHTIQAEPQTLETQDSRRSFLEDFLSITREVYLEPANSERFSASGLQVSSSEDTQIPDGEELILKVTIGKSKILIPGDLIAINGKNDIYLLMAEFFSAVKFPIVVNNETGEAEGWFISEDQKFSMSLAEKYAQVGDQTYSVSSNNFKQVYGEMYVSTATLKQWFGMEFSIDFSQMFLQISTAEPLPAEQRYTRRNRKKNGKPSSSQTPELPLEEKPYQMFSIPMMDVNVNSNFGRFSNGYSTKQARWSVIGAGDLAYHTGQFFVSGDQEDQISILRFNLEKESEDGDLLGPLAARNYTVGDISTTPLSIAGGGNLQQGVRVTNSFGDLSTSRVDTDIRGEGIPDWDVELYRDERFLGITTVGEDGQYIFDEVLLNIGQNDFRLVFYGPQGEIREEELSIPVVNPAANDLGLIYDVSLSRKNSLTYEANRQPSDDDGTLDAIAQIKYNVGAFSVEQGLRHNTDGNSQKHYLTTGFATAYLGTLFNVDTAYEVANNAYVAEVAARTVFGDSQFSANFKYNTVDYTPGIENPLNAVTQQGNISLSGPTPYYLMGRRVNYVLSGIYSQDYFGTSNYSLNNNYSIWHDNLLFNTGLTYEYQMSKETGEEDMLLHGSSGIRGFYGLSRWRVNTNYDVYPEVKFKSIDAEYSYPLSSTLRGQLELSHNMLDSVTEATLSLNKKFEQAIISPRISIDSEQNVQASLNVRFGLGADPVSNEFYAFNTRLSNSGSVAAFVFLDKNANGEYDEGEEPISGAELRAVQANRSAFTNEDGVAFIPNLPRGRVTDIHLVNASLDDPFWVSNYAGISVRPRPGVGNRLEFPVIMTGEVDGTVYMQSKFADTTVPARQFSVHLHTLDGEQAYSTTTAYDGFYVFSGVKPGVYYLAVDEEHAKIVEYQRPAPKKIIITADGNSLYAQDIVMVKAPTIDYMFSTDLNSNYVKSTQLPLESGLLRTVHSVVLGTYFSRLGALVEEYRYRNTVSPEALERSWEDFKFVLRLPQSSDDSIEYAQNSCSILKEEEFDCAVDIFTTR